MGMSTVFALYALVCCLYLRPRGASWRSSNTTRAQPRSKEVWRLAEQSSLPDSQGARDTPVTSPESQSSPHTPISAWGLPRTTRRKVLLASFSWKHIGAEVRMCLSGSGARWAERRSATGLLTP